MTVPARVFRLAGRQRRAADPLRAARRILAELAQIAGTAPGAEREHLRAILNRVVQLAINAAGAARHARCRDAGTRRLADQLGRAANNLHLIGSGLLNAGIPAVETAEFLGATAKWTEADGEQRMEKTEVEP
jgi:hypothetical protein